MKTREQLDRIFSPRSLAVVGTNRAKGTVPHDILANILRDGFTGTVYPVSPRERSVGGVKAYPYVVDIEDEVDLAVVVFPASVAHLAMEQIGEKGIKAAVVISAGFREAGGAGIERERTITEIARRHGISFIGPNCLGVINTDPSCSLNASFARAMPEEGPIAFLSQSGALCTAVLDYARAKHIGFSKFVSFGNKADVSEIDLLSYLKDDPKTKVILMYLEQITDGRAFIEAAREVVHGARKPLLVLKAGRTAEGARAAASHTGALAGSDEICDAALRQAGVIRCDTIDDLFNCAIGMAYEPLPSSSRVAIVTNAGGPGVLATDMAIREGLSLARLGEETRRKLRKALPAAANTQNPVDVIGDAHADRYRAALSAVLEDPDPSGILVILTPQSMTDIEEIAREVSAVAEASEKPVYASFMGEADVAVGVDLLQRRRVPHYQRPEDMCKAMAQANRLRTLLERTRLPPTVFGDLRRQEARSILERSGCPAGGREGLAPDAAAAETRSLAEADALRLLDAYGLPVPRWAVAESAEEAAARASELGFPVAVKVHAREILHKSDVGGVVLDVPDAEAARQAYRRIQERIGRPVGVIVTPMVQGGLELIAGMKRDPAFGPVIVFGLGGIFVEVFREAAVRVAPLDASGAEEMIRELRAWPILAGARGRAGVDVARIRECLERLSVLAIECPGITELDINPLIALRDGAGCVVADAKIITRGSP